MVSDAVDGSVDRADEPGDREAAAEAGSPIVDRWTALDRGWRALALGLGVVAAHAAGQVAGLF